MSEFPGDYPFEGERRAASDAPTWELLDRLPTLESALEAVNDYGDLILQELQRRADGQPTVIESDVQLQFHLHVYLELFRPWLIWDCRDRGDMGVSRGGGS